MGLLDFDPASDRIVTACRRLRSAYNRAAGADVPIVEPGVRSSVGYTSREGFEDLDKMLAGAVAGANALAATDNDWPPSINTYCTVVMVAEAFGCGIVWPDDDAPWTTPAITDISQVWSLKPMPMDEAPQIRRTAEWIDYAQRKLGAKVPINTMDLQTPLSVATHVMDSTELLTACLTHPREVHHLCDMITEFSIEMMHRHLRQMEHPGYPGRNFPSISDDVGICLADDTPLIMLSPELYRQFALPYNNRISEAFGGVHIHSCGDYRHNLDNLLDITNVRSIQLHAGPNEFPLPETPLQDDPFNRARGRVTYYVDFTPVARGDEFADRPRDHYRHYVLPRLTAGDMTGCILQSCGAGQGLAGADASLAWTREQLRLFRDQGAAAGTR